MKPERTPSWYLFVVLRNRRFLLLSLLAIMVPTVVITYILPRKYTVTTVIMPPEERVEPALSIAGLGLAEFAGFFSGGMGFSLPLMTTMSDVYLEILRSRTLIDEVITSTAYLDSVDLRRRFERNPDTAMYLARKMFNNSYSVAVTPSGFIEIKVTTRDPWYSVEVSERVIAVLDSLNTSVSTSRAHRATELLEMRLTAAESLLENSTDRLYAFEIENGVIAPDEQLTQLIQTLANLKQQYLELQAGAAALNQGFAYGGSTAALELERRAAAILGVIRQLEAGTAAASDSIFPAIAMADFPRIQFTYASLRSDYEMALQLSSALRVSLEQSRVEELRRDQTVRTLDPPRHPGWKSRPKRLFIWIEVFLVSILVLLGYIFIRERIWRFREEKPEAWSEWDRLLGEIRKDFSFLRRKPQPRDTSSSRPL